MEVSPLSLFPSWKKKKTKLKRIRIGWFEK
jgi:hypothetical protein